MFAIVEFKGIQFKAIEGKEQILPLFPCKVGDKLTLDKLTLLDDDKGVKVADELKNAKVTAEVVSIEQTPKVGVLKFHSKKHYQKIGSHRQDYVRVRIDKISV